MSNGAPSVRHWLLGIAIASLGACAEKVEPDLPAGAGVGGVSGVTSGGAGGGSASGAGTSDGHGGAVAGVAGTTSGASGAISGGPGSGGTAGVDSGAMSGGAGGETSGTSGGGGSAIGGAGSGGASDAGASGMPSGGAGDGGTSGGAGSATAGGAGAPTAGAGGAIACAPRAGEPVELETSIPQRFRQPVANAGTMVEVTYPNYYYTDLTAGQSGDPSRFVLERRAQPIMKPANVYLPYQYSESVEYPVIYVLHGITDNQDTWLERGSPHPAVLFDNLIAAGEIRPIIAVFPNGNSSVSYLDRDFGNQAGYYFFANELVNDLIPFIESKYSVAKDRSCRAVSGFSMGGMQTINAGLCQSLEHFGWFGALSAAPTSYSSTRVAEYVAREDPAAYPIHFFYNTVGASDGTARASHEAAVLDLTSKSPHFTAENFAYHTVPGDHNYPVASIGLYNFLRISFRK